MLLKILLNLQENTCARVSLLMKLQALSSGTDVLLFILQNCQEHIFYGTSAGDCFCMLLHI